MVTRLTIYYSLSFAGCSCKERRVCSSRAVCVCVSILADLVAILATKIPRKCQNFLLEVTDVPSTPHDWPLAAHL